METKKELKFSEGQIIRKCPQEHFTERQFLYGNPYSYLLKYADYFGGSPERRYALWQFNDKTLEYELYQTASENDDDTLREIAIRWEYERREAVRIKELRELPREYWFDNDKEKYAHIKTIEEEEMEEKLKSTQT